jgi:Tfp pilus assembly protein PilW
VRHDLRNLGPAVYAGADADRCANAFTRAARRLREQRGLVLMELVVTVAFMGLVIGGITSMLVSATKHETALNLEFQAQESARLALSKLRIDLHCASFVAPASGTVAAVALTLTDCPTGIPSGTCSVTWSTVANGARYDLRRVADASCAHPGASTWANGLTAGSIFTPAWASRTLPAVAVDFSVAAGRKRPYRLADTIYLRNGVRQ